MESIPLFKESHPWEMRSKLAGENFYSATSDDDDKVHVGLVYGLDAATPCTYSATSQLLPDDPRLLPDKPRVLPNEPRLLPDKPRILADEPRILADEPRLLPDKPCVLADEPCLCKC